MFHVNISDEVAKQFVESSAWERFGLSVESLAEATEAVSEATLEAAQEAPENSEDPFCPLCETVLEEALPEETLSEHVQNILDLADEAFEELSESEVEDGEDLDKDES
tara:strand:+ start:683 stop:1006 length:324 start_codon:yes stop_codon:yes gene_type:complete